MLQYYISLLYRVAKKLHHFLKFITPAYNDIGITAAGKVNTAVFFNIEMFF